MKQLVSAFFAGLIFAFGLAISGMTLPKNIIGFLDISGNWKPALLFVMVGAVFIYSIAFRLITKRKSPVLERSFHVPPHDPIDFELLSGAMIFGIGWALAGFCPGPALVSLGAGTHDALIFVAFMALGMVAHGYWRNRPKRNVCD